MKLTTRNIWIIGAVVLVLVAAAGWFLSLSPRMSQADEITVQAEQLQMTNLQLQNRYNQTLTQAQSATQAAGEAQALFSTMPEEADLPKVLTQIADAATSAGIKPTDISTISTTIQRTVSGGPNNGQPAAAGATPSINLAQMDINMTVAGKRPQLMKFLTNLQSLDRAMLIKSNELTTSVSTDAKGNLVQQEMLKISGSMFVLKSELPDLVATVQKLLEAANAQGATTPATAPGSA